MKGYNKLILVLDNLLIYELTAVYQYMVHSGICENWGYKKLHIAIREQAMDEMHHAVWLVERIVFLEGTPTISKIKNINVGSTVLEIINNDHNDELFALSLYNKAIILARSLDDQGTIELLTKIGKMEENHIRWAELQCKEIENIGIKNYLFNQIEILVN